MTNKSIRDYINLIEAAQQENLSEDGVESWASNPSDRRHSGHESYMTPEYMLAHYKKRLAQIAAGKHKYPKEVAQLQAKIAKLEKQGVEEGAFDNYSPMAKDSIKADKIKSLKNLIAIAREQGRQLRAQELELELKKLQGVSEEQVEESTPDALAEIDKLFRDR